MNDLLLEKFVLGELPAEQLRQIKAQLESDEQLKARVEALRASDLQLRGRFPGRAVMREVARRAGVEAPRPATASRGWWVAVPAAALALVIAVVVLPARTASTGGDVTRIKGDARLLAYRQHGSRAELLDSNSVLRPGDALQLRYRLGEATIRHGVVLSIDGQGSVTTHLISAEGRSEPLSTDGEVSLSRAYLLDDAPHFERFFLVLSATPFDAAPVLKAAEALARSENARDGALLLPAGFSLHSVSMTKETP